MMVEDALLDAAYEREEKQQRTIDALVTALEACRGAMSEESPLWSVTTEEYDGIKAQADAALALARAKE